MPSVASAPHGGGDLEQSGRDSDPAEPEPRGDAEHDGPATSVPVDGADHEQGPDEQRLPRATTMSRRARGAPPDPPRP